jgi:hypothetical protein
VGERTAVDGAFKTPGLRNVELTGPYMHNGGMATLRQVVDFYNRGGDFARQNMANLDVRIAPLGLSDDQKNALVAFLLGLTDPRVKWEKAPFDHPSLCVPNGAEGDQTNVVESTPGSGEAKDAAPLCLPAVGAAGAKTPLQPFLGLNPFQTLPEISITGKPADPTNDPNPTFTFTVDAGATVQCALDASPYTACASPQSYTGLTNGAHSFKVRAADAAGNVNVASYTFTVDTAPPLSIDAKPATVSNTTSTFDAAGNQSAPSSAVATTLAAATKTGTALPAATATPPTATAGRDARPRPTVTKTARPVPAGRPAKRSSNIAHKRTSKTRQQAQHVRGHQRHQFHHGRVGHRTGEQSALAEVLQQPTGALLRHLHDALRHLLSSVGV